MFKRPKHGLQLAILLSISYSFAYNECNICICCEGGPDICGRQGIYKNLCYSGCKPGYYSPHCVHACSKNCKTCSRLKSCDTCKDGYYIGYLNHQWKYQCTLQCPAACKTCTGSDSCTECQTGKFGSICQYNCSLGCENNQCSLSDGRCNCKPNFSGLNCTTCVTGKYSYDCNIPCPKGCGSNQCHMNGKCFNCSTGLVGDKCDRCKYRKYGSDCHLQCPPGCAGTECYMNGTCISCISRFKGSTCSECIDGYYGDQCNNQCLLACLNDKCKSNGECVSCKPGFTGNTCSRCVSGKYGNNCSHVCSNGCVDQVCERNGYCKCKTGFDGNKSSSCLAGKYGTFCNNTCPSGCYNKDCDQNGKCHWCENGFTGETCDQCVAGIYGINCTKECSPGCGNDVCERNGSCSNCKDSFKGKKCDDCMDGNYGVSCNLTCPSTCYRCTSMTNCTSCQKRHWGSTCTSCPPNCWNCSSDSVCLFCDNGFYGPTCSNKCSSSCLGYLCNKVSGICIKGCIDGFYGNLCEEKCSLNCNTSKCDRQSGACLEGCQKGYTGERCHLAKSPTGNNKSDMGVKVGAGAGGALFVLIVLVVFTIIIILRRRKRGKRAETGDTNGNETENDTIPNSEIDDIHVATENNYNESIRTNVENMAYSNFTYNEFSEAESSKNADVLYAKPIKSKNKAQGITLIGVTVNNPIYEKPEYNTVNKAQRNKPSIASKPVQSEDNNSTRKSDGKTDAMSEYFDENDAALEIEEDIESLSSKTKSVIFEENARKAATPDLADTYYNVGALKKGKIKLDQLSDFFAKKTKKDFADEFQGYNTNKAYIASIGPTTEYMDDMSAFWIMVWQEKVGKIVMLTNLSEGGVPKCDQYWPEKDFSLTFANIHVTCQTEEEYFDYTIRSFIVQKDKGTLDDVTSLIEFREKVISTKTDLNGPILVHCSAGIGRTGTYIALDSVTKEGEADGEVDIFAFVRNMRKQRVNMIQTAEQYQYLHNAIVHTLTFDSKAIQASKFREYLKSHSRDNLGQMFEKLQASVEQRSNNDNEAVKKNKALKNKNRDDADIPGDRNRPKLYMYMSRKPRSSDYINALYVNSFKSVNRYLIAQTPLPETVEDFLTLIIQEKVSCIISMGDSSTVDKDLGIYCPADNQTLKKGAFTVKTERGNGTDQYMLRKMKISYNSKFGAEEFTFPHVQFIPWGNDKLTPEDPVQFVQFVREMELKFCGNDPKRLILVHCSTGASRSGLFCVVSTLLEKVQIDQEVSVVNTVRQIKYRRHMAIPNKEQYIFSHHCVNEYMRTFETYSNFELK